MNYWEITILTVSGGIDTVTGALTAAGFDDLVIEDQEEFESFLQDNREYWDYIDETLQAQLQGLSQIKLYLEAEDAQGLSNLQAVLQELKDKNGDALGSLEMTVTPLAPVDWEESWKENYPPQAFYSCLNMLSSHDSQRLIMAVSGANVPADRRDQASYVLNSEMKQRARAKAQVATALQMTLPGVPCIYYGDEIGMEGFADPSCRRCFEWDIAELSRRAWDISGGRILVVSCNSGSKLPRGPEGVWVLG